MSGNQSTEHTPLRRRVAFVLLTAFALQLIAFSNASGQSEPEPDQQTPAPVTEPQTAADPAVDTDTDVDAEVIGGGTEGGPVSTQLLPWMAALLWTSQPNPYNAFHCGGALVDPQWVLTTAWCVGNWIDDPSLAQVVLGRVRLSDIAPADRRAVDLIVVDPLNDPDTFEYDIALVHLATPAVGVPTLAYSNDPSYDTHQINGEMRVAGWGSTSAGGSKSNDLRWGLTGVITAGGDCGQWYGEYFAESMLCGQGYPSRNTCNWDQGGPVFIGNYGGWRAIGVVSRIDADNPNPCTRPNLYARVSASSGWIDDVSGLPSQVGTYHAITPSRLVDTRNGTGGLLYGVHMWPQWTINPQVTGLDGVPLTDVAAVAINVVATSGIGRNGWLTAYPTGVPPPNAANLNFEPGQTVANLVTVQLGQGGKFSLTNTNGVFAGPSVHVVIDIIGWYGTDDSGGFFRTMAPRRIADSRTAIGPNEDFGPVITQRSVRLCGPDGPFDAGDPLPSAVVINATVISKSTGGWLTVWPDGDAPNTANLNYGPGQVTSNLVTVGVGPGCEIKVGNSPGGSGFHDSIVVVLDLVGWFGPLGDATGARFHAMPPNRIVDT